MKYVALLSGGKDSCFNLLHCQNNAHVLTAAASLGSKSGEELDSYLYQTVGQDVIELVAQSLTVPLYRQIIKGVAVEQSSEYGSRKAVTSEGVFGDETEDLFDLLAHVKTQHPDIEGVSVGAILSNYQRVRIEHVCQRLSLIPLCYLWQRKQEELFSEMIAAGIEAVIIKVAGIGLSKNHLGRSLVQMQPILKKLNDLYGAHICGEGGEYETLTLDSPMFQKRINLDEVETIIHQDSDIAPVAYLRTKKASLQDKGTGDWTLHTPVVLEDPFIEAAEIVREMEASISLSCYDDVTASGSTLVIPVSYRKLGDWVALGNIQAPLSPDRQYKSIVDEVQACFRKITDLLTKNGLSLLHLAFVTIIISDISDFALVNSAYRAFFGVSPPARVCIAQMLPTGVRVQFDCISHTNISLSERRTLHVQSLSYWAPANIGPYSQCVVVGEQIFISGQIGMLPSNLALPDPKSLSKETALSFQHTQRILSAIEDMFGCNTWVAQKQTAVCWLVNHTHVQIFQKLNDIFPSYKTVALLVAGANALPKDAQIEVQVIAHTGKCTIMEDEEIQTRQFISKLTSGTVNVGGGIAYWELATFGERGTFSGFISLEGVAQESWASTAQLIETPIDWSRIYTVKLLRTKAHAESAWSFCEAIFKPGHVPAVSIIQTSFIATRTSKSCDFAICFIGSFS